MTLYKITIGYQSGSSGIIDFAKLCQITGEAVYTNTRTVALEMQAYAEQLTRCESPAMAVDKKEQSISFLCSGGGYFRQQKEKLMRTILRGVLSRVHEHGGEVNITVH